MFSMPARLLVGLGATVAMAAFAGVPASPASAAALLGVPAAPVVPAAAASAAKPACPVDRPDEAAALAAARACGGEVKIAGLTNEYDEGWAQPDGQVRWQHHFRPVRVERNNAWVSVDTTLVADADGTVRPKAAAVDLAFSGGGSAPMVTVGEDGGTLKLGSPLGSLPKPVLDGDTATYPEVLPGVDLKLRADVEGYAQVLVVKDRKAAENAKLEKLQFPVSQSGLTLSADKAGNLKAAGKDGKARLVGNAPLMWDAPVQATADGTPRAGGRTKVMPSRLAGGKLSVTPVQAMLDDPATVYPVYLDPAVQAARSEWTMIDSGNPATSYWNSSQNARVGTNNGGTNKYRSFYRMRMLGTPIAGKHIRSSTLWVEEAGAASCTARRVDLWSTTGMTSATTWNNPPTFDTLQSPQTSCPAGSVGFSALEVTQAAASRSWANVNLGLRSPDETDNSYYKEFSNNPYLSISYSAYATITSVGTVPELPCVTGAGRPYINTATPALQVRVTDPESASVRAEIEWSAVGGSRIGSAQTTGNASGSLLTANVPAGAFADGSSYSWRARGNDSITWGPWRSPCEFTVDTTAPSAPPTVTSTTYPSGQWAGGAATAGTFTFDPAGVSDAAAYEYGLDTNPPTQTVAASAIGGSGTVSITPGTDGPHSLYVRTRDRAANVSETTRYDFNVAATPDAVPDGLVLRYLLAETSGSVAADSSGNRKNGTVVGTPNWRGDQGLTFDGSSTYIKVPDNIMSGMDSISVSFDVNIDPDQPTPYFLYGFGTIDMSSASRSGYLYSTGKIAGITRGNGTMEQVSASGELARGIWKHVTYTQTGNTGTLYEDGVAIATNSSITVTPGSIGGGTTTANHIGRIMGFPLFKGSIKDFRVYNRALSTTEVATLADPVITAGLAADAQAIDLGDVQALTTNLTLPSTGANGSAITWATSNPAVITAAGVVTRPQPRKPNATATLTATLTRGGVNTTRAFLVTVKSTLTDEEAAADAAAAIVVRNIDDVRGNLTLPASGTHDTTITWSSSDSGVIDGVGVVHRHPNGKGTATVTLTATVTAGEASATRDFTATVPELPAAQPKTGYLFSYFTGEGTADGEQIYSALSKANDPLSYQQVKIPKPVLTSTLGTKGLRDPFIIRSPEGDKFYQIATDLKTDGNGDGDASQRTGSKSIMVWESTDLVNWTDQRLRRTTTRPSARTSSSGPRTSTTPRTPGTPATPTTG
jgi:hypothetical protein